MYASNTVPEMAAPSADVVKRAREIAEVVVLLAREASELAKLHSGEGRESHVAARAAQRAHDAAAELDELADAGAGADHVLESAMWALNAAAIAVTQAKLNTPLGFAAAPRAIVQREVA